MSGYLSVMTHPTARGISPDMRLLGAAAAAYVRGERTMLKIEGNERQITCLKEALLASRMLYEELRNPNRSTETVIECLERRRRAATRFRDMMGTDWPL